MLSEKDKDKNLQNQAGFLPKNMEGNNGHIKSTKGNPMQRMTLPNLASIDSHILTSFKAVPKTMQAPTKAKERSIKRSQTYLGKRPVQEVGPHLPSFEPDFISFSPILQVNPKLG